MKSHRDLRTGAVSWVAVFLAAGATSCQARQEESGPVLPNDVPVRETLSEQRPTVVLQLPRPTEHPAMGVVVAVEQVVNPDAQGVQVGVSLETTSGGQIITQHLGEFFLFPADRPASFTIPIPESYRTSLARMESGARIICHLEPARKGDQLSGVQLHLGPLRWVR